MNLLLLLSAFLTALTGAITGVRPERAVVVQEQVVGLGVVQERVAARIASRPVQGWPGPALVRWSADRSLSLLPLAPIFGQRRRE